MFELIGGAGELGWVTFKALLLYLTAIIGFRLGERRTLAVTLLVAHRIVARLRCFPGIADIVDHKPRLLVVNGEVLDAELRQSGLTRDDLYGLLRQHGIDDLSEARFVVFERRGRLSICINGLVK